MTAIIKEYGTSIVTCLITIMLLSTISNGGIAKDIGALTPTMIQQNVKVKKTQIKNIPKYNNVNIGPFVK